MCIAKGSCVYVKGFVLAKVPIETVSPHTAFSTAAACYQRTTAVYRNRVSHDFTISL